MTPNPMRHENHWEHTAPPPPPCGILEGDMRADVAVIGAGLTGLRAAVALSEAGASTAVLDAGAIGFGASGRSGGQVNPMWRATPDELRARLGADQADRLIAATLCCAEDLFADIARLKIDCDPVQAGWIQAAHCRKAAGTLSRLADAWRGEGARIDPVEGAALHAAIGSRAYHAAQLHHAGGSVEPLALTRGYARAAHASGAALFEHSPAEGLERIGGRWRIQTPKGVLTADTVLLTTNAYTGTLCDGLRHTVLPMVSVLCATEPLPAALRAEILPGRRTLADTRRVVYYMRYDREGRLLFGCVGSADAPGALGGTQRLRRGLSRIFPQLTQTSIPKVWTGRFAVTEDYLPNLFEPAPGLVAGLGYNGRGIAMSSVMGRTLARRVLGGANSDTPFPVKTMSAMRGNTLFRLIAPFAAPLLALQDRIDTASDAATSARRPT